MKKYGGQLLTVLVKKCKTKIINRRPIEDEKDSILT